MNRRTSTKMLRPLILGALAAAVVLASGAPAFASKGHKGGGGSGGGGGTAAQGYDISYPQCGGVYPSAPAFGVVGVNGGLAYRANTCLASEYQWATGSSTTTGAKASLYANTGNPGPVSTHWPKGQTSPMACDGTWSAGCSYDYGWNAAQDSFADAAAAIGATAAGTVPWWLDVETANSWNSSDLSTNAADVRGAVAYLQSRSVTVGVYSTGYQWGVITGGLNLSSAVPDWVAGASSATSAPSYCSSSFSGGAVRYVQYQSGGYDADYSC